MSLTFNITPGYNFSASEKVTYPKLNLLGSPVIISEGQASTAQIADGAITDAKLANPIDINSKLNDHNIDLDKLASGTHGQILYYNSTGDLVTLAPGTSGKFLKTQGPGADPKWEAQEGLSTITVDQITAGSNGQRISTVGGVAAWETVTGYSLQWFDVWQQESTNTAAGSSTTSADTRTLNQKTDPDSLASLASNQITLQAGDYYIDGLVSFNDECATCAVWLYDTTAGATIINGGTMNAPASNAANGYVAIRGRFTLSVESVIELRQQASVAVATTGWGKAANIGSQPEIYTQLRFVKLS